MICLKYERWGWQCVEWQMSRVDIHLLQYNALFFSWPSQKTNNLLVDTFFQDFPEIGQVNMGWLQCILDSEFVILPLCVFIWRPVIALGVCLIVQSRASEQTTCLNFLPWSVEVCKLLPFATLCMVSQVKQAQLIVVGELDENSHHTENT